MKHDNNGTNKHITAKDSCHNTVIICKINGEKNARKKLAYLQIKESSFHGFPPVEHKPRHEQIKSEKQTNKECGMVIFAMQKRVGIAKKTVHSQTLITSTQKMDHKCYHLP